MTLGVLIVLSTLSSPHPDSVVRGIYINPYQASSKAYLEAVFAKADSGLITAIVVDFKSDYGFLCYDSKLEQAIETDAIKRYLDLDYLVEQAALHNIKLVARIVCFRDNYCARYKNYGMLDDSGNVWLDKKGLAWINPYNKHVRNYLVKVTREIVDLGVSSIAYDYIRFPTDGDVWRIRLTHVEGPRSKPLLQFLEAVHDAVGDSVEIGVCVFGFSVWHYMKAVGQDIAEMAEYIDVLYPMLYPSHFGWSYKREVNEYWRNYWIYFDSVKEAMKKLPSSTKIIPFVQSFDYGAECFDDRYVFAQMQGALAAGADGFMVWHAGGDYTMAWPPFYWVRNSLRKKAAQVYLNAHTRTGQWYQDVNSQ
jgi:hypothetical protein